MPTTPPRPQGQRFVASLCYSFLTHTPPFAPRENGLKKLKANSLSLCLRGDKKGRGVLANTGLGRPCIPVAMDCVYTGVYKGHEW